MQPQRETMTDNLADIIHIIHIGCKSGTLTVERGEGRTLEEGYITFSGGRAVDAKAGQQSGLAAFNYLNMWQACRFSFINHEGPQTSSAFPSGSSQTPYPSSNGTVSGQYPGGTTSTHTTGGLHSYGAAEGRPPFPSRTQLGDAALQYPENIQLHRMQRRLLLLINGQRNIHELARLMVRNLNEVQILLNDLERSGLIQQ